MGGWVAPTVDHSVLLLQMRLLLMVLLLLGSSSYLYPPTIAELKRSLSIPMRFGVIAKQPQRPMYLLQVAGAGATMFLALTLLYVAISSLPTGIAVTMFFIYPAITVLFGWKFWGDRPTPSRFAIMAVILVGIGLTTPGSTTGSTTVIPNGGAENWHLGIGAGVLAGVSYAVYTVLVQVCLRSSGDRPNLERLHPIPFSLLTFGVALVLASGCLLLMTIQIAPPNWPAVWGMSLLSAAMAMAAYLLNSFGIRSIGAAQASLVSASTPILTTVLAMIGLNERVTPLQWFGILMVTSAVARLSTQKHSATASRSN